MQQDKQGQDCTATLAGSTCWQGDTLGWLCLQVRGYEAQMRQLEAQVRSRAGAGNRAELIGQRADAGAPGSSASQRDRLLHSTQKLDRSGERINQSRQLVAGMEVQPCCTKFPEL